MHSNTTTTSYRYGTDKAVTYTQWELLLRREDGEHGSVFPSIVRPQPVENYTNSPSAAALNKAIWQAQDAIDSHLEAERLTPISIPKESYECFLNANEGDVLYAHLDYPYGSDPVLTLSTDAKSAAADFAHVTDAWDGGDTDTQEWKIIREQHANLMRGISERWEADPSAVIDYTPNLDYAGTYSLFRVTVRHSF